MGLTEIFIILFIHWIADFVVQTHWQAQNKSKNNIALLYHISTYTLTWFVSFSFYTIYLYIQISGLPGELGFDTTILWFFPITFVSHFITDYFTSRLNSYLYKKGDIHNFFVSVGFDQILHYLQLFLTYHLLTN